MIRRSLALPAGFLACAGLLMVCTFGVLAQASETNVKTEATLAPPDGAANTAAKGKAKTLYKEEGGLFQKLIVTCEHLDRKTDYRLVADGIELGVFSTKGNSGTLKAKFRDPVKGNASALPEGCPPVKDLLKLEIYNVATGELTLTGDFVLRTED
jgi:hypothetical protein